MALLQRRRFSCFSLKFVNDNYPSSKLYLETFARPVIEKFVYIGANATILGGLHIAEYSIIGAGNVLTKYIPPFHW